MDANRLGSLSACPLASFSGSRLSPNIDTLISDEQSVTFDSNSQLLDERKRSVLLTVQAGTHDPHKRYDLVMRDAITKVEVLRHPIKVDLAFGNDF